MRKTKYWDTEEDVEFVLPKWLRGGGHVTRQDNYTLDKVTIGNAVRKRRKASGLSLRACAKWVGISHTHMSNLETGKKAWSASRLQDVTNVLSMQERSTN